MKTWPFALLAVVVLAALVTLITLSYREGTDEIIEETVKRSPPAISPPNPPAEQVPPTPEKSVLTFCSDPWPPYAGHAGHAKQGYILDILRAIFEPLGYEMLYVNKPWSRCIAEVRNGTLTSLAGADVDEVPDFVFPKETIGITRPAFFVRQEDPWTYEGIPSLADKKLGMIQDYTYEEHLDVYIRENLDSDKVLVARGNDALKRLIDAVHEGRIDTFVENAPVVYDTFRQMEVDAGLFREAGAPKRGVRLFIPFSPALSESVAYARHYDEGIRRLRAGGQLTTIMETYGLQDWYERAKAMEEQE